MPTKEVVDYQLTTVDLTADQRRRAVLAVASAAGDPAECVRLLDMLGLRADEGVPDVPAPRG
ncbi:hypothetical protein [Actinophytocola sp.]|uniref:hypothetical protein n=1 Tax=Actinophytocola sp. TaxID=1872138 RepID=UPI002D4053B1|nr:hypothetical protein [Actinophytocola sp.]HYQ68563.1 hypothetical protein [Actinophytocola sp.]